MTNFDVYAEEISLRRRTRLERGYNEYLAMRLRTKTREETVAELLNGLTIVVGVKNVAADNKEKALVF